MSDFPSSTTSSTYLLSFTINHFTWYRNNSITTLLYNDSGFTLWLKYIVFLLGFADRCRTNYRIYEKFLYIWLCCSSVINNLLTHTYIYLYSNGNIKLWPGNILEVVRSARANLTNKMKIDCDQKNDTDIICAFELYLIAMFRSLHMPIVKYV